MTRAFLKLVCAMSLASTLAGPAFSQAACAPEKLNAAIDTFSREPFGARTWRVLNGLGDPGLEPSGPSDGYWAASEAWKKRVAALAPDMADLQNVAYDCRMGYPLEVLNARVAKLGAADPYIKQWLAAQSRVMKACSSDAPLDQTVLPPPLEVNRELAVQQQYDRAYQEASVAFYRDKAKAVQLFKAIGASNSPHRAAARYNVANLLVNANNMADARKEVDGILLDPSLSSVHQITKELLGYIANKEDTPEAWSRLLDDTVAVLNKPLAVINGDERSEDAFSAALYDIDYAGVREKQDDWWIKGELPEDPTLSKAIMEAGRKHAMALWMMTGQTVNAPYTRAPWSLVGDRWNAWSQSFIDRALALTPAANGLKPLPRSLLETLKATPDDATRAKLWQAAKDAAAKAQGDCGAAPETAALGLLALQATRLSAQAGKFEEIYATLPGLKIAGSATYREIIVPKLAEFLLASGNAEEGRRLRDSLDLAAMTAAFKSPDEDELRNRYATFLAFVAEDEAQWLKAVALSAEDARLASPLMNLLPAEKLRELAGNPAFSPAQQALLSRAAWTRNYARGLKTSEKITDDMLKLNPEIAAALEAVRKQYPALKPQQALTLTILRNPRFGILVSMPDGYFEVIEAKRDNFAELDQYDHNDKNWWCPLETDRQLGALRREFEEAADLRWIEGLFGKNAKSFLAEDAVTKADRARITLLKRHPMVKAISWSEVKALAAIASAPKKLSQDAVRWARSSKADNGAAEALALAVRATRYGCNWHGGHKAYSKPAQELLQARFKDTTWAKQTPYWFDCLDGQWDEQGNRVMSCKPKTWPKQAVLR